MLLLNDLICSYIYGLLLWPSPVRVHWGRFFENVRADTL